MRITVIGAGYVGLVSGTCLADTGNNVTCVDVDAGKIERLNRGEVPIYEPGLTEMIRHNAEAERLRFTTDLPAAVRAAELIFLAVGTPQADDGSADLSYLWQAADDIAPHLNPECIVLVKSTVPVGTNAKLLARLEAKTGRPCRVASNPEFLKEGAAVNDFLYPDRVVVGVRSARDGETLRQLYAAFLRTDRPFLIMSPESAELTKYVANGLLATKISFINQMANLTERFGGDINDVRRGIGHDSRIGFAFLFPGAGYGGSCFPKDIRALANTFREAGLDPWMMEAVDRVNEAQKQVIVQKIETHYEGQLTGKTFAVWGLSFKPKTDDIREAPALVLIDHLLARGASVRVSDPEAVPNVRAIYGDKITYCKLPLEALRGADGLAIMTEWSDFRHPDFNEMRARMQQPVIFDGRNLYEREAMRAAGFTYYSIGRAAARPAASDGQ